MTEAQSSDSASRPRPDMPLVSIVTPCLNHAEFIEETLLSVLTQDYPNIEYIVVDGGSTDGSVDIIRKYEPRLSTWVSEPDHGQADAINKGFRMASGEIIAWINSDDLYAPGAVSKAMARFAEKPDLALFYGDAVFTSRQGNFRRYFTEVEPFHAFRLLNCSDFIMQPTTFFRRDRAEELGYLKPDLHWTMDYDLWCRFAARGWEFHYEPEIIAANREYYGTKTTAGMKARIDEILRTCAEHRTSIWPHARFSYQRSALSMWVKGKHPWMQRLVMGTVGRALTGLAFRNVIYALRHRRVIGGVVPHSDACLKKVRLRVPVYRPVRGIILSLHCPYDRAGQNPQAAEISVNGQRLVDFDFRGDTFPQDILLACGEAVNRDHQADVRIDFRHAYRIPGLREAHAAYLKGFSFYDESMGSGRTEGATGGVRVHTT